MKQTGTVAVMLGVLIFGCLFASKNGWPEIYVFLLASDAIITVLYVLLLWRNRRFIRRFKSMSPEEQQSIVEKMPPPVKDVLNRELKS